MQHLDSDSGRYLLDLQISRDNKSSLTIIDSFRQLVLSRWSGPSALMLIGMSCLPMAYRRPGRYRCDRYLVGHLICAGAALGCNREALR